MSDDLSKREGEKGHLSWAANIRAMLPTVFMIGVVVLLAALQYAQAATSP